MSELEPDREKKVLAGRYRLDYGLGEGGMGSVWRAHHLVLDAPVAVKVLTADLARGPEARARFMREARAAASLRSPNVVQILDYGVDDEQPFIVMELLEGEPLNARLDRVGRLGAAETAHIIAQVARAIGRAHEAGIIHRDLKPENVFLVRNDDEEVAKVLDFGVAKVGKEFLTPSGSRTRTGSMLGTPCYMSPEQAQGNKTIDYRSDLWSLGVIAFECMTGEMPFESDGLGDLVLQICVNPIPTPSSRAPVPVEFDAWFARAAARDPEQRFQSARELAEALRDALQVELPYTLSLLPGEAQDWVLSPPSPAAQAKVPPEPGSARQVLAVSELAPDPLPGDVRPATEHLRTSLRRQVLAQSPMASAPALVRSPARTAQAVVGLSALAIGVGVGLLVVGGTGRGAPSADAKAQATQGPTPSVAVYPLASEASTYIAPSTSAAAPEEPIRRRANRHPRARARERATAVSSAKATGLPVQHPPTPSAVPPGNPVPGSSSRVPTHPSAPEPESPAAARPEPNLAAPERNPAAPGDTGSLPEPRQPAEAREL